MSAEPSWESLSTTQRVAVSPLWARSSTIEFRQAASRWRTFQLTMTMPRSISASQAADRNIAAASGSCAAKRASTWARCGAARAEPRRSVLAAPTAFATRPATCQG